MLSKFLQVPILNSQVIWFSLYLEVISAKKSSEIIPWILYLACPSLSECWGNYLEARKSPLWAEQFFRCGQLTTYWECAEKNKNCRLDTKISQRLYAKVRDECEGKVHPTLCYLWCRADKQGKFLIFINFLNGTQYFMSIFRFRFSTIRS